MDSSTQGREGSGLFNDVKMQGANGNKILFEDMKFVQLVAAYSYKIFKMEPINLSILAKQMELSPLLVQSKPTMKFGVAVATVISFFTPISFRIQIKDRIYIHL